MGEQIYSYVVFPAAIMIFVGMVIYGLNAGAKNDTKMENLQREVACLSSGRDFIDGTCRAVKD